MWQPPITFTWSRKEASSDFWEIARITICKTSSMHAMSWLLSKKATRALTSAAVMLCLHIHQIHHINDDYTTRCNNYRWKTEYIELYVAFRDRRRWFSTGNWRPYLRLISPRLNKRRRILCISSWVGLSPTISLVTGCKRGLLPMENLDLTSQ